MLEGKTQQALRLLTKEGQGSVLPVNKPLDNSNPAAGTVLDALRSKDPLPQPIFQ